jgi:hypothetical protein
LATVEGWSRGVKTESFAEDGGDVRQFIEVLCCDFAGADYVVDFLLGFEEGGWVLEEEGECE